MKQTNEIDCKGQTSRQATLDGHGEEMKFPSLEPESCVGGKQQHSKSKVSKNAKSGAQRSNAGIFLFSIQFVNIALPVCGHLIIHICFCVDWFFIAESPNILNPVVTCRYDSSLGESRLECPEA